MRSIVASLAKILAAPFADRADDLDAVAAHVMAATGSTFVRRSHVVAVLRHPLIGDRLMVYCGPAGTDLTAHWPGLHPQRSFFDLLARAASAVTGNPAWLLEPTIVKCHAAALRGLTTSEPNAHADGFGVSRAEMECSVFAHDGGGSTLTISKRPG